MVISGDDEALDQFAAEAAADGVRVRRVKVDYASHSHHVERIRERLLADTAGIAPREAAVTFHSTVTATALDTRTLDGSYWYDNLRSQVRFADVVDTLMREPGAVFVEVSPHPVLQVAMEEAADTLVAPPLLASTLHRRDGSAATVLASLAELHVRGVPVNWTPAFAGHRPRTVPLPSYPFQRRRYWLTAPDGPDGPGIPAAAAPAPGTRTADLTSQAAVLALVCAETAALLGVKDAGITGADIAARPEDTFKALGFDSAMAVGLREQARRGGGPAPARPPSRSPTPPRTRSPVTSSPCCSRRRPPPRGRTRSRRMAEETRQAPDVPDVPGGPQSGSDDDLYALIERGYV